MITDLGLNYNDSCMSKRLHVILEKE